MEKDKKRIRGDLNSNQPINYKKLENRGINSFGLELMLYEYLNRWNLR